MTRVIFQGGLNWRIIDREWPNFRKAFSEFSIDEFARFDDSKVERLMKDSGIVRNRANADTINITSTNLSIDLGDIRIPIQ